MKKLFIVFTLLVSCLATTIPTQATTITYDLRDLGYGNWTYDYVVHNDSPLSSPIKQFLISFDILYLYPEVTAMPVGWTNEYFDSMQNSATGELNGSFVATADGDGISAGDSQGGFSILFTWDGYSDLPPADQAFEIYGGDNFSMLDSGRTVPLDSGAPVPEPSTVLLLGAGLAGLGAIARRRAAQKG